MKFLHQYVTLTDKRGIQLLHRMHAQVNWVAMADDLLDSIKHKRIKIFTGFPVNGKPETDGPIGAIFLAKSLATMGGDVAIYCLPGYSSILKEIADVDNVRFYDFNINETIEPNTDFIITIEICGRTVDGRYLNMRGEDISSFAPKFETSIGLTAQISIGDGGNEFGMGSLPDSWFKSVDVAKPESKSEYTVTAEVSNWGALAIIATLQAITKRELLPKPLEYKKTLDLLATNGFVDGINRSHAPTEDAYDASFAMNIIEELNQWSNAQELDVNIF